MKLSGGKKPVITNYYNKTVLLPLCDNKCDWNKQKSAINCFTKIWQYVVSLIYCIDKNKNNKFTGLNIKKKASFEIFQTKQLHRKN
jgi:hypothetical protein